MAVAVVPGSVAVESSPGAVPWCAVMRKVPPAEIPAALLDAAQYCMGALSGGGWWELGEFVREGRDVPTLVVGRRHGGGVQYGFSSD